MRSTKVFRALTVGALALVAAAGVAIAAPSAYAAPTPGTLGTATLNPATGLDVTAPQAITSAGCPTTADGYNAYISGPGKFSTPFLIVNTQSVNFSTTAGFPVQYRLSMADAAKDLATTLVAGEYDLTINCVDTFTLAVRGTFTTAMYFTDPTHYQSTDPNAPVTTSTALAASPASPASAGTPVTFTATVTPATATGTVQFLDGTGNLGTPVTVSGGKATLTTSALTAGTHSVTAAFTGSAANISNSTSPAVSYVVTAPVATATTTALAVTPSGSAAQFSPVTLSATVAPAAAVGAVQFADGTTNVGSPVALSGGTATLTISTLTVGAHSFTATFVPADTTKFGGSTSAAVPLTVTAFTGATASESISTTVVAGSLVISVANANVTLPSPTLTTDGSLFTTTGALNPITVTDTRAGNPGWTVSGQVSDFSDGQSHGINGANLGWTPKLVDNAAAQTITVGPVVAAGNGLAPGAPAPTGVGLGSSRTLATAGALGGNGTAHLGAGLALNVPTSTVAGTYTATLTLTAI